MGTGNDNNSWGNNANSSVFQIVEDAIANALTSTVTGGTLDLSGTPPPNAASQVRYAALIFQGVLTSAQTLIVPNLTKWWWVQNATSAPVGAIQTFGTVTGGTLYTNGTYHNVPLTGGSGSGATGTVVVSGAVVTSVTITLPGINYLPSDTLSALASNIGGTGSGFSIPVASVGSAFSFSIQTPGGTSQAIPQNSGWQLVQCDGNNNIIVSPYNSLQAQMPDGVSGAPSYSWLNDPASGWRRAGTQDYRLQINGVDVLQITGTGAATASVVNVLSPNQLQVSGGNVLFAGATVETADGSVSAPGLGFNAEPTTGFYRVGLGDVAYSILGSKRLEITSTAFSWQGNTIAGTDLSPTSFSTTQNNYNPAGIGVILTLGSITGGSAYVAGTYENVPLTGGTGSGAKANITVSAGGAVNAVTITNRGLGYVAGDTLSAVNSNLGGAGSGFSVPVATVDALTGSCLRLDPTASCSLTGLAGGVAGREIMLLNIGTATLQCPALSGSSLAANQFANTFNLAPGQSITLRYDGTSSLWRPKSVATAVSSCAIAAVSPDLLIVNNSGTPTTKLTITASEAVLCDASGNAIKFESVSVGIDSTTTGPGGCDTGTRASSAKYFIWLVSDGVNINAVLSTSSTLATVLSNLAGSGYANYIYGKRIGANFTDSSSNLYKIKQIGRTAEYVQNPNPSLYQFSSIGSIGGTSTTWVAYSIAGFVPTTAAKVGYLFFGFGGNNMAAAPNGNYDGNNSNLSTNPNPLPLQIIGNAGATVPNQTVWWQMESQNVYLAGTGLMSVLAWEDAI